MRSLYKYIDGWMDINTLLVLLLLVVVFIYTKLFNVSKSTEIKKVSM